MIAVRRLGLATPCIVATVWAWWLCRRPAALAQGGAAIDELRVVGICIAAAALGGLTVAALAPRLGRVEVALLALASPAGVAGACHRLAVAPSPWSAMAWWASVGLVLGLGTLLVRRAAGAQLVATAGWMAAQVAAAAFARVPFDGHPWSVVLGANIPAMAALCWVAVTGWRAATAPAADDRALLADPLARMRDDMAAWLGDPDLRLGFPASGGEWVWVQAEAGGGAGPHRATTEIHRHGTTIGAIEHDAVLMGDPALRTAAALGSVAWEANGLLSRAEEHLRDAQALTERLLQVDGRSRAELLGLLEAGPLAKLQESSIRLRCGAGPGDVLELMRAATAELRDLSHGLHPPELDTGGLAAALPDRSGAPTRRFAPALERTLYLCARDDRSSWFDDRGTMVAVHRTIPLTDPQVADRVAVLGGRVHANGAGSTVELDVPV